MNSGCQIKERRRWIRAWDAYVEQGRIKVDNPPARYDRSMNGLVEVHPTSSTGLPSRGSPVDDTMDMEVKNEHQMPMLCTGKIGKSLFGKSRVAQPGCTP